MPRKETPEELQKTWITKVRQAKKARKIWEDRFHVEKARNYFEGVQNENEPVLEWITINKIYAHVLTQLPKLYSLDPYFRVKLKRSFSLEPERIAEFERKASVRQAYLNYLKGAVKLKPKSRLGILDAFFEYGVMKVHHFSEQKLNERAGEPIINELGEELFDEEGKALLEPDEIPINERYMVTRIHPKRFFFGIDSGPLSEDWDWVAEEVQLTLEQAKKDKRFRKVIDDIESQIKAKGKGLFDDTLFDDLNKKDDPEHIQDNKIATFEIYDLESKKFLLIIDGLQRPVIMPRDIPKGVDKHPFSILTFTPRDDSPYPIPPVSQSIDLQREFNTARSRIMTHRKRFNRKYEVYRQGLVNEDEIGKLENGGDGTLIITTTPNQVVRPINDAPLDQSGYIETLALNNDMTEMMGTTGAARGIADSDSATESVILEQRMDIKEGDRLSMVMEWVTDIGKKLDMLVQTHIVRDEAIKITGVEGERWEEVRVADFEDIAGEYEYGVNTDSTLPRNRQTELAQFLAVFSQVIGPLPEVTQATNIMKKLLEKFGIEDDVSIEEIRQMGQLILQRLQGQGGGGKASGGGSVAGVTENNPVAKQGGIQGGAQGGNNSGGGAPQLQAALN